MSKQFSYEEQIARLQKSIKRWEAVPVFGILGSLSSTIVGIIFFFCNMMDTGVIVILLAIALLILGFSSDGKITRLWGEIGDLERAAAAEEKAAGKWEFPAEEFYRKCLSKGVKTLDQAFFLQKAVALAKTFVDEPYHDLYVTEEKVKAYFAAGKVAVQGQRITKQRQQEEWNRVPHEATPNAEQVAAIALAKQVWPLQGLQKRRAMLEALIAKATKEAEEAESNAEAASTLGTSAVGSAHTQKTLDWASLGGAASALAGPAAGATVAQQAIETNKKIEAQNQANMELASRLYFGFAEAADEARAKAKGKRKEISRHEKEIKALSEKVVLENIASTTLFQAFSVSVRSIKKTETNVLSIALQAENKYVPDVPDGVQIVTDGVILAEICAGKTVVGKAYIPLPMYGIPCGKAETFKAFCEYYMETPQDYTLKIIDHNLWAMEA